MHVNYGWCVLLAFLVISSQANLLQEVCNWKGSSFTVETNKSPGVFKVDLRCTNGYVQWSHPNGGVRISFKAPMDDIGANFELCLLSSHAGVNIFSEDKNGLKILRSYQIDKPKQSMCSKSENGKAIIYLEASGRNLKEVRFDYQLKIANSEKEHHKECDMCKLDKLVDSYCNGDFAVKARVVNRYLHEDENNVQMDVWIYHIFKEKSKIFKRAKNSKFHIGSLAMATQCAKLKNNNHYIFMGKIKKGIGAHIECHLKFSLWRTFQKYIKCKTSEAKTILSPAKFKV